ncbi:uncharacterized protein KGF55_001613 [Candida pseudojiufengensis]|uniref:uncharacterized protein n=1 Tax=Candida pseudojiufengensis TaxID=497109 RepID=UPI002225332B|nr:uncharacterized protein KGF55_001613 [Candida pseudojiufengensis]KAI5965392.1 hypothetical protein KGF55_001613 [Candida pseudojiufengensis]
MPPKKYISTSETLDAKSLIAKHKYLMVSKSIGTGSRYVFNIFRRYKIIDKLYIIQLDQFEDTKKAKELEDEFNEIMGGNWLPQLYFNHRRWGTENKFLLWEDIIESMLEDAGLFDDDDDYDE